jgi:hypothetical protein
MEIITMATKSKDKTQAQQAKTFEDKSVIEAKPATSAAIAKDTKAIEAVQKVAVVKATNDKEFHVLCQRIKVSGDVLATTIHNAGLYALQQVNIHGQTHHGLMLIEAVGTKHDKVRILKWLMFFGKFGYKNKLLIYKKRKDIAPENVDNWLKRADETPYWDLTPQPEMEVTIDYLSMLKSIVSRHEGIPNLEEAGKKVTEKNVGVLAEVSKLLKKFGAEEPKTA